MTTEHSNRRQGGILAFFGIAGFSLTLPATRLAVLHLDPWFVALGRGVLAALLAAVALRLTRQPWPGLRHLRGLSLVALGVIVGFPVLTAWAMQDLPASHGGITLSITPLATALLGARLAGERLPARFWLASLAGGAAVFAFSLHAGDGVFRLGDLWLLAAALLAAMGYAEGARLAPALGGWQVICWALVIAAPLLAAPLIWIALRTPPVAPAEAWAGFAYVGLVSQFLAFMFWYRGLALGGIARTSQIQLLQPFLTLGACALLLGEPLSASMLAVAAVVVSSLWVSQRAPSRLTVRPKPL